MKCDCAIVGGGPAGLNAALVLGRARKTVALFDNSQPRNGATRASHGFITRDRIKHTKFLPEIKGLRDFYGKTLFNCPFCDDWQLQ